MHGIPADPGDAFFWFRQAADSGHSDAAFAVARCFQQGKGVPANSSLAGQWLQRAANAGHVAALALCPHGDGPSVCRGAGQGVFEDHRSLEVLTLAAEAGDASFVPSVGNGAARPLGGSLKATSTGP